MRNTISKRSWIVGTPPTPKKVFIGEYESSSNCNVAVRRNSEFACHLFQVLIDRLRHLKHVQFLRAKDRLQLVVRQDFSLILWVLQLVLLNVRPNLFGDLASWKRL